ncbi:hypothetical protein R3P38DRAFT_3243220 [Favolaschia claudopus]|uniref:Uncharacterized protein n=1 Tax=Favolaschia claudopus TaxID=2862362 RepID=A0AAV9Z354_9AGAR
MAQVPLDAEGAPAPPASVTASGTSSVPVQVNLVITQDIHHHASAPVPSPELLPGAVRSEAPWVASLYSVVPAGPLVAINEPLGPWYSVTRGRYVGVTNLLPLAAAATISVPGASYNGYKVEAFALNAFNAALALGAVQILAGTEAVFLLYLFSSSTMSSKYVDVSCVIYPRILGERTKMDISMLRSRPLTLGEAAEQRVMDWFTPDPLQCPLCYKLHIRHEDVHDGTFSVIFACPHTLDSEELDTLSPNKCIDVLMRSARTCPGHVVVVKHAIPPERIPLNRDMPLINLPPRDYPKVDELVRRLVKYYAYPYLSNSHAVSGPPLRAA